MADDQFREVLFLNRDEGGYWVACVQDGTCAVSRTADAAEKSLIERLGLRESEPRKPSREELQEFCKTLGLREDEVNKPELSVEDSALEDDVFQSAEPKDADSIPCLDHLHDCNITCPGVHEILERMDCIDFRVPYPRAWDKPVSFLQRALSLADALGITLACAKLSPPIPRAAFNAAYDLAGLPDSAGEDVRRVKQAMRDAARKKGASGVSELMNNVSMQGAAPFHFHELGQESVETIVHLYYHVLDKKNGIKSVAKRHEEAKPNAPAHALQGKELDEAIEKGSSSLLVHLMEKLNLTVEDEECSYTERH